MTTFTPNIGLTVPANGADVGTWDTAAMNPNLTLTDSVIGQVTTISLNNSNVVLNAAQMQSRMLVFNSTLTGSVTITFATSFIKDYEILHSCTGSSAFTITLETTSGGQVICAVPGEIIDVVNDGSNLKYKNFGRVGSYWDFCGSSSPNWNDGCTVSPYLNCNGTTFSSATYPVLALLLSGNTLPNSQGKYRLTLNQSASTPISSANGATFNASAVGNVGGTQTTTLSSQNVPRVPIVDLGHAHSFSLAGGAGGGTIAGGFTSVTGSQNTATAVTGITAGNASPTSFSALPPSYVGGLTLIRAA